MDAFLILLLIVIFISVSLLCEWIIVRYDKRKNQNNTKSSEQTKVIDNVNVIPKNRLTIDLPFPKTRLSGVLFDNDTETYCLFALDYPELHMFLKPLDDKILSQEEINKLMVVFIKSFRTNLKVRLFFDESKSSNIH